MKLSPRTVNDKVLMKEIRNGLFKSTRTQMMKGKEAMIYH